MQCLSVYQRYSNYYSAFLIMTLSFILSTFIIWIYSIRNIFPFTHLFKKYSYQHEFMNIYFCSNSSSFGHWELFRVNAMLFWHAPLFIDSLIHSFVQFCSYFLVSFKLALCFPCPILRFISSCSPFYPMFSPRSCVNLYLHLSL